MSLPSSELAPVTVLGPGFQKPTDLLDRTFELFGFLPADDDIRWPFLERYHTVRSASNFKPINFENARRAIYLSPAPSFQTGYVTTLLPENVLQLDRALDNLAARADVFRRFRGTQAGYNSHDIRLALTDRMTADPSEHREVTPCPEALYQVRLFDSGKYLARVGFNLHSEGETPIMSITNIQGTPGSVGRNRDFQERTGVSPFNLLVQRALMVASVETPELEVRGVLNPERGNSQLYWGVLEHEGVQPYHAYHKATVIPQ